MRKYQPIWESVKTNGVVSLAAPIERHRQIILAVRKEKNTDTAWKLECLEARTRYKIKNSSKGSLLTFSLEETTYLAVQHISIHDL